jgi:hypothetical protein
MTPFTLLVPKHGEYKVFLVSVFHKKEISLRKRVQCHVYEIKNHSSFPGLA